MLGPGAQQSERGERKRGLEPTLRGSRDIELSQAVRMLHLASEYFAKEVHNKNSLRLRPELIKNDKAI